MNSFYRKLVFFYLSLLYCFDVSARARLVLDLVWFGRGLANNKQQSIYTYECMYGRRMYWCVHANSNKTKAK